MSEFAQIHALLDQSSTDLEDFPSDLSEISQFIAPEFKDFYSRLHDRLFSGSVIRDIPKWIIENTTLKGKPWSFKDHEFQIAIAGEMSSDMVVMKCSQVGLSELAIRISLALLAILNGKTLIYTLPSAKFANAFCKSRIDPVIEGSTKLTDLLKTAVDSGEMKQFGHSFLHIKGAATATQAISIPGDILMIDEYDFCNMQVLTTFFSRLRHAENGGIKRKWSTPTVDDFGVAGEYARSTQNRYLVRCMSCAREQAPDFKTQVRIPGYHDKFDDFDKEDLIDGRYDISGAYISCQYCEAPLDASLAHPERRRWAAENPTRQMAGYAVKPFDVIKYNPTPRVIAQLGEYSRRQDFDNFVLGETHASPENQIHVPTVRKNMLLPELKSGHGYYMGIDVGKTCHVLIGKPEGKEVRVVRALKVRSADGPLLNQLVQLYYDYGCYRAVIDAGPDFSLGQALIEKFGQYVAQCIYIKGNPKNPLFWQRDDKTGMVAAARTKGFDVLVKDINDSKWLWPISEEMNMSVLDHLKQMKRVEEFNDEGEKVAKWVKNSDNDHYMHAAFYLNTAIALDGKTYDKEEVVGALPGITGISISKQHQPETPPASIATLVKLFGVR